MQSVDIKKTATATSPYKPLTRGRHRAVGRNSDGRITTRHKGAGVKRLWREVDFRYDKKGVPARVETLEYDPNRTAFIALLAYTDGEKRYVLAPEGLSVGAKVITDENAPMETGNRTMLGKIPVGTAVYNVELEPNRGAALARSAGNKAVVLAQEEKTTHMELPSKEIRRISSRAWASIGSLSNAEQRYMVIGNAGRNRRRGVRPTVRGSAMNPVDHPHGGGEGRTLIGRRRGPATPWGKPARGVKTRGKKQSDKFILRRRRK